MTSIVEAKVLSELFPSSSVTQKRPLKSFDPTAECVALPQQKKKKAATRQKFKSTDVFMLPKFSRNILKNKERKALKCAKRNKKIMINHQMSALQVKNVIRREFAKDHPQLKDFIALECEANNLLKYASYEINGTNLAERKGQVHYISVKPLLW